MKTAPKIALCTTAAITATAVGGFRLTRAAGTKAPPAGNASADHLGYQDTPMVPGSRWHVHDGLRPQPQIVTPGTPSTPDTPGRPPSDALVLFDGTAESVAANWRGVDNKPTIWRVQDGAFISTRGSGYVFTKQVFGNCQLHVEWAAPTPPQGNGQGRGNSGIFLEGRYEVQVLDSFGNPTYPDGQAAAVYGQYPPLANASRPAGEWQTYDIFFTSPRFNADKSLASPAYVTVVHNGVLAQNHVAIMGDTGHKVDPKYTSTSIIGSLGLQDHGNPVRYRNIWIRAIPTAAP